MDGRNCGTNRRARRIACDASGPHRPSVRAAPPIIHRIRHGQLRPLGRTDAKRRVPQPRGLRPRTRGKAFPAAAGPPQPAGRPPAVDHVLAELRDRTARDKPPLRRRAHRVDALDPLRLEREQDLRQRAARRSLEHRQLHRRVHAVAGAAQPACIGTGTPGASDRARRLRLPPPRCRKPLGPHRGHDRTPLRAVGKLRHAIDERLVAHPPLLGTLHQSRKFLGQARHLGFLRRHDPRAPDEHRDPAHHDGIRRGIRRRRRHGAHEFGDRIGWQRRNLAKPREQRLAHQDRARTLEIAVRAVDHRARTRARRLRAPASHRRPNPGAARRHGLGERVEHDRAVQLDRAAEHGREEVPFMPRSDAKRPDRLRRQLLDGPPRRAVIAGSRCGHAATRGDHRDPMEQRPVHADLPSSPRTSDAAATVPWRANIPAPRTAPSEIAAECARITRCEKSQIADADRAPGASRSSRTLSRSSLGENGFGM